MRTSLPSAIGASVAVLTVTDAAGVILATKETPVSAAVDAYGALFAMYGVKPVMAFFADAPDAPVVTLAMQVDAARAKNAKLKGKKGKGATAPVAVPAAVVVPQVDGGAALVVSPRTPAAAPAAPVAPAVPPSAPRLVSDFGTGRQVMNTEGRDRVQGQRAVIIGANVAKLSSSADLRANKSTFGYRIGDALAQVGYDTQARRKASYDIQASAASEVERGLALIAAEDRHDVTITAGDFALALQANGAVRFDGLRISDHAIRGLMSRFKVSGEAAPPAYTYLAGLSARIDGLNDDDDARHAETAMMADVLRHECSRMADRRMVLRTRRATGDIYAIVSESYTAVDFPTVAPMILASLSHGAKGSFAYDAATTMWSLRTDVFTPVPTADHVIGENHRGFSAISGNDRGMGRIGGSGGIVMAVCLNATEYLMAQEDATRVHRCAVSIDIPALLAAANASVAALTTAWGTARDSAVDVSAYTTGKEDAHTLLSGIFRDQMTRARGALVGVCTGNRETHVARLASIFADERRDNARIVRADLAQAHTRYSQTFPYAVESDVNSAVGAWLASGEPVGYLPAKGETTAT